MVRRKQNLQIRMASPEDIARVASVLSESFAEHEFSYIPAAYAATVPTVDQVGNRLSDGPAWVAVHNGEVVGTVSVVHRGEALYIRSMAVLPAARGQRIGELLMNEVESFAAAHGYRRLVLSTTPFLHPAIRLYEKSGFRRNEAGPYELFGTPLFTMEKALPGSESKGISG